MNEYFKTQQNLHNEKSKEDLIKLKADVKNQTKNILDFINKKESNEQTEKSDKLIYILTKDFEMIAKEFNKLIVQYPDVKSFITLDEIKKAFASQMEQFFAFDNCLGHLFNSSISNFFEEFDYKGLEFLIEEWMNHFTLTIIHEFNMIMFLFRSVDNSRSKDAFFDKFYQALKNDSPNLIEFTQVALTQEEKKEMAKDFEIIKKEREKCISEQKKMKGIISSKTQKEIDSLFI